MNTYYHRRSTVKNRLYSRGERFLGTKRSVNGQYKKLLRLRRAIENPRMSSEDRDKIQNRIEVLAAKIQEYDIHKSKGE